MPDGKLLHGGREVQEICEARDQIGLFPGGVEASALQDVRVDSGLQAAGGDGRSGVPVLRQSYVSGAELDRIVADIYRAYEPMKAAKGCRSHVR